MEWIYAVFFLILFMGCVLGAPYLLYKSVRLLLFKQIGSGLWMLAGSFVLGLIIFLVTVAVNGARTRAQCVSCSSHLKQIVLFMKMYACDHQETYPSTFDDMVGTNYLRLGDKAVLICPATGHAAGSLTNIHHWTDYVYVTGLTEGEPGNGVVAFCLPEHHKGEGANVAFIGGQVQWFSCWSYTNPSTGEMNITFHDLTNNPALFYGTTNEVQLADLMKRTRIIYPTAHK